MPDVRNRIQNEAKFVVRKLIPYIEQHPQLWIPIAKDMEIM